MRQLNSAELNEVNGALTMDEASTMVSENLIWFGQNYGIPSLRKGCEKGIEGLCQLNDSIPNQNPLYVGGAIVGVALIATAYVIKEYIL